MRLNISSTNVIRFPYETPPAEGKAIEVSDGILWIRLPLPMALDHVNVYALRDGAGWCIVDTGYYSQRGVALWENLLSGVLGGDCVTRVILTHHHPDHVGMVGWFQTQKGAELLTTQTAFLYARMLFLDTQEKYPKEILDFYQSAAMDENYFKERAQGRPFNFSDIVYPMPLGFTRIKEGDCLKIGERNWHVYVGNGHAPEHATLWCKEDQIIIAGDQVLPGISSNIGVYPIEPMADPLKEWIESCEKFYAMSHNDYLVLGGHKLPFKGLRLRLGQLIENHHSGLERLYMALKQPKTATQCFEVLYKRSIGKGEYILALIEAIAHLNHLLYAGRIIRRKNTKNQWVWMQNSNE